MNKEMLDKKKKALKFLAIADSFVLVGVRHIGGERHEVGTFAFSDSTGASKAIAQALKDQAEGMIATVDEYEKKTGKVARIEEVDE